MQVSWQSSALQQHRKETSQLSRNWCTTCSCSIARREELLGNVGSRGAVKCTGAPEGQQLFWLLGVPASCASCGQHCGCWRPFASPHHHHQLPAHA